MPVQHRADPENTKLCQAEVCLEGAGLDLQILPAGVTFTLLLGQGKVSQANLSINQYFKNGDAPHQRSNFQGVIEKWTKMTFNQL